jgi:hypothetical protein
MATVAERDDRCIRFTSESDWVLTISRQTPSKCVTGTYFFREPKPAAFLVKAPEDRGRHRW